MGREARVLGFPARTRASRPITPNPILMFNPTAKLAML